MFWRPRRPSLLMLLLALLGLGWLLRRSGCCRDRRPDRERRARARRKFKEGLEILFGEDGPDAPPAAGERPGE